MSYRWGGLIDDADHAGHRTSFLRGADSWQYATNPTVPWYESYDSSSSTVVDLRNTFSSAILGMGVIAEPGFRLHIPRMLELWVKHDVEYLTCAGVDCAWYIGTSTSVAASQIDEWSVWIHEIGHAQNISHQSVDSHPYIQEGGTHDHTMRAWTWNGNTDKRNSTYGLRQHERVHACKPYELSHRDITCGSL